MTEPEKTNRHRLEPTKVLINYDSTDVMGGLQLPRKYTWVSHHISVGKEYDQKLINRAHDETYVTGEWIRLQGKDSTPKYEIHIKVNISTEKSPNIEARSKYFRERLGLILEELAFAETALLKSHPSYAGTRIIIDFIAKDSSLTKSEYWHRLGYWAPESMRDKSEVVTQVKQVTKISKDSKKPNFLKKSGTRHRRRHSNSSAQSSKSSKPVNPSRKGHYQDYAAPGSPFNPMNGYTIEQVRTGEARLQ